METRADLVVHAYSPCRTICLRSHHFLLNHDYPQWEGVLFVLKGLVLVCCRLLSAVLVSYVAVTMLTLRAECVVVRDVQLNLVERTSYEPWPNRSSAPCLNMSSRAELVSGPRLRLQRRGIFKAGSEGSWSEVGLEWDELDAGYRKVCERLLALRLIGTQYWM